MCSGDSACKVRKMELEMADEMGCKPSLKISKFFLTGIGDAKADFSCVFALSSDSVRICCCKWKVN